MTLDKNSFPYYDDFDAEKKYLQLLFNPSRAVQARELSQLQSILQDQVAKFGNHIFKEGSMVLPGESSVSIAYPFVKLEQQFNLTDIDVTNFVDKKIVGLTSGTAATVLQGVGIEGLDPNTLYLRYETGQSTQSFTGDISNGSATITDISIVVTDKLKVGTIVSGANIPANTYIIEILSADSVLLSASATDTQNDISLTATTMDAFTDGEDIATIATGTETVYNATVISSGLGSIAEIKKGIYFAKGYFCIVDDQILLLDKYSNTPSYNIGLTILDSFITEDDDATLNDPAGGTTNFNAPGAHRYKIDLILSKVELGDTVSENFIQLITVKDGEIQKLVTRPAYAELEKTLARRTYDESGDYTVRHFPIQIREHLNDGTNGGVYSETEGGDETKLIAALDPGKAYVRGYEIETQSTQNIEIEKSREFISVNNAKVGFNIGNYVQVDGVRGSFDITSFETVNLYDTIDAGGVVIGTARIRSVEFVSGTPGDPAAKYNLYLFDIEMDSGAVFADVRSIGNNVNEVGNAILVSGAAVISQAQDNILLMTIPEYAVKTLTDTIYSVKRYLTGTMTANAGDSLQLTAGTNELFDNFSVLSYHVSITAASATAIGNGYAVGDVIDLTDVGNSVTLGGSPTGKTVTITIPDINGSTIAVIATINKTLGALKTKTLTNRVQSGVAHTNTIQLDRADVYRINSITIDDSNNTDITTRYVLDNGQRDNYYDRGKLYFDQNYGAPLSTITIDYDYLEHGAGDYFSVDSYSGAIEYKDIPFYFSRAVGSQYDLINVLDFRPRVNNAGTGFTGAGGSLTELVVPDDEITTDYDAYIGRIDKIVLTSDGEFKILTGAPDINPVPPAELENSMILYILHIPPYTFKTSDVAFDLIDNRRYTMRDIGKLEKRIDNLEYYTSLSLLEKATADLFIDDGTGLDRFKNGFVVDNFASHRVGDITLIDYLCAIDAENGFLRPPFFTSNVGLDFVSADSTNFTQTGDLITLPYTTEVMISQLSASKTENVNPYTIISWLGRLELDPPSDDWFEENRIPDKIIVGEDSAANNLAAVGGSTIWNDWTTTWVGKEISRAPVPLGAEGTKVTALGRAHSGLAVLTRMFGRAPAEVVNGTFIALNIPLLEVPGSGGTIAIGTFRDNVTKESGQTRTGVRMDTVMQTVFENVGDKVVSVGTVPYMREKTLTISAERLRPNTRVYPFFDGVDVSTFCNGGQPIISNVSGKVSEFTFDIPSTDSIKFRTGERVFKLIDNSSNNDALATTSAESIYTAKGILQTKQATLISTRAPTTVRTTVSESRVTTSTNIEERIERVRYSDPLAQTFLIDQRGGAFVSKIDIYFNSKDDNDLPVTMQIREVINGYPGQRVIPFAEVSLVPSQVTVDETSATATSFVFSSPVYLQDGQEYCFVLLSNSNKYNVWVSKLGEFDAITNARIVEQPYAGSLFKSQNASTWTAEQEEDIKFKIHKCVFDTNVTTTLTFKNNEVRSSLLFDNPFITEIDSNTGNIVTVLHRGHGLATGNKTTISGVVGTHNGIPDSELNGLHTVTVVDVDRYNITVTSFATEEGRCGGIDIEATRNIIMDVGNVNIQNIIFPETSLLFGIKTTNLSEVLSSTTSISLGQNILFTEPQLIRSEENEDSNNVRTVHVIGTMMTDNANVSPIIDLTRASIITISNRINDLNTDETEDKNGKALAKYITKRITLKDSAEVIRVQLAAARPANATIEVYAKILTVDEQSTISFDEKGYTLVPAIDYPLFDETSFKDYTFELDNISPFNTFAIKIVMRSVETSDVPMIKDFRAIACGS